MPGIGSRPEAACLYDAIRCQRMREKIRAALLLYTLVYCSDVCADDHSAIAASDAELKFSIPDSRLAALLAPASLGPSLSRSAVPSAVAAWDLARLDSALLSGTAACPPGNFQPKKHSIFALDDAAVGGESLGSALRSTTVWQRLRDFRANGRVRLLTLWETQGSSISLQAGKHGDPSLQWSSRSMNRGGATRGLLDQWVAASFASHGPNPGSMSHSTGLAGAMGGTALPGPLGSPSMAAVAAAKPVSLAPLAAAK